MSGYHIKGDGAFGSNIFEWDAVSVEADNGGTIIQATGVITGRWKRVYSGAVNVKWFGAKGDNNQTLYPISYLTDIVTSRVTITQQTIDAIAINNAFKCIRSIGKGSIYIPSGTYRTYGYLEPIDFNVKIYGDGINNTILINCDNSPINANGYGILVCTPETNKNIKISDITLDGNAIARNILAGEYRNHNIAIYGKPNAIITNISSINSPIDCFYTDYSNTIDVSLKVKNSFRNTISNVGGYNQDYNTCIIEKGGKVNSGTNPKSCLDIEPNLSSNTIKNISYNNCIFRESANNLTYGVWAGNVKFNNCSFFPSSGTSVAYFRGGQFIFDNCTFSNTTTYDGVFTMTNPVTGEYANSQYVELIDCNFEGIGLQGYGLNNIIKNCSFKNSLRPLIFGGDGIQSVYIDGLYCENILDNNNYGTGAFSSLVVLSTTESNINIQNVNINIVTSAMPTLVNFGGLTKMYGIFFAPTISLTWSKLTNISVMGYYRKYPSFFGLVLNASNFRDWGSPSLPPADTAGQIIGTTSTYYRNCSMYGDFA